MLHKDSQLNDKRTKRPVDLVDESNDSKGRALDCTKTYEAGFNPLDKRKEAIHLIMVSALWLLSIIPWYWSATHLDVARDLVYANAIASGSFVITGPNIGRLIDLAPYWFYLLALPVKVGFNWLGTILFIGFLSGLKFPLAYRYFYLMGNARAGIIACFLLLIFGWVQHQWLFPTHTVMTGAAVFALLILFNRMTKPVSKSYMFWLGAIFGFCFHAHPTILPLGLLLFWGLYCQRENFLASFKLFLMFSLGLLLVMSPVIWNLISTQPVDSTGNFISYLQELHLIESIKMIPYVFLEIFWGEFGYLSKSNFSNLPGLTNLVRYSLVITLLIIIYHLIKYLKPLLSQYWYLCITLLMMVTFVSIIREQTTYYMLWSSAALLVVPVSMVLSKSKKAFVVGYVLFSCLFIWVFLALTLINNQRQGATYLDIARIFGFSKDNKFVTPVYMIPAGTRDEIAQFFCNNESITVHGSIVNNLILDYQGGERFFCPDKEVVLSGINGSSHLTFLPEMMVNKLNIVGGDQIGMGRFFTSQPIYPQKQIEIIKDFKTYIPKNQYAEQRSEKEITIDLNCNNLLVIHHVYHFLSEFPAIDVQSTNQVPIVLLANNANTFVYGCTQFNQAAVTYQVNMEGKALENVDITAIEKNIPSRNK